MDLSALIFVVLAVAWAVYLIPNALKHDDELAGERPVEDYSPRLRVLSRLRQGVADTVTAATSSARPDSDSDSDPASDSEETTTVGTIPASDAPAVPVVVVHRGSRAAARRAAKRRRIVLAALVLATAVLAALAGFAIVPWWSLAIPAAMIVAFLVIARFSVRRSRVQVVTAVTATTSTTSAAESGAVGSDVPVAPVAAATVVSAPSRPVPVRQVDDVQQAIADEGSLWDPLPMTLPTYVGKAHARRTVRTIELTGVTSSGHDAADTSLAKAAKAAEAAASDTAVADEDAPRKVSGA